MHSATLKIKKVTDLFLQLLLVYQLLNSQQSKVVIPKLAEMVVSNRERGASGAIPGLSVQVL